MPTFGTPSYGARSVGGNLTITRPADLVDGDLLVVALRAQESGTGTWVTNPGFTLVSADEVGPFTDLRHGVVWVKQVLDVSAEPATYTFSGAGGRGVGIMVSCKHDAEGDITRVGNLIYGGRGFISTGVATIPDSTLDDVPALSLLAVGAEVTAGVSGTPTIPASFTEIGKVQSSLDDSTVGTRTALWLGWRAETDTTSDGYVTGYPGAISTGVYYGAFSGGTDAPVEPGEPEPGFRSVAQMLATPGATWAHRGGSANWPEMSEMAYRNAALAGYGALEFSCQRTVDGVWIGLHDLTLDRTSGVTGLPDVRTMTWAQVQEYRNTSQGGNEPYWRMTDFLDTYASTHVVIMDIKNSWAHAAEWFGILQSYTNDRQRIIVKYFGTTSFVAEMETFVQTAGFSSWGYYYPEQVADGTLASTQDRWSILGMDAAASQADWDAILSYGKPVVAHIIQNSTSANMALTKGAHMLQCANVASIPAVGPPEATQPWDAVYSGVSRIPRNSVYVGTQKVWPSD